MYVVYVDSATSPKGSCGSHNNKNTQFCAYHNYYIQFKINGYIMHCQGTNDYCITSYSALVFCLVYTINLAIIRSGIA